MEGIDQTSGPEDSPLSELEYEPEEPVKFAKKRKR
jgi:hypothetical protein